MAHKLLQIVSSAYRATIEEQDDTVLWISQALAAAGVEDMAVLLCGNAVNYAVRGPDASGLSFGGREQTQPPRLEEDIARLVGKGVTVLLVAEDLAERGVEGGELVGGVATIARRELPTLFDRSQRVWRW